MSKPVRVETAWVETVLNRNGFCLKRFQNGCETGSEIRLDNNGTESWAVGYFAANIFDHIFSVAVL